MADANQQGTTPPSELPIDENAIYDVPGIGKMNGKDLKSGIMMERDYRQKTADIAKVKQDKEALENFANTFFAFSQAHPETYNEFLKFHEGGGRMPTPPPAQGTPPAQGAAPAGEKPPASQPEMGRRVEYDRGLEEIRQIKQEYARLQVDKAVDQLSAETGIPTDLIDKEILPQAVENHVNGKTALENLRMQYKLWAFEQQRTQGQTEGAQRIQERLKGRFFGGASTPAAGTRSDSEQLLDFIKGGGDTQDRQRILLHGA